MKRLLLSVITILSLVYTIHAQSWNTTGNAGTVAATNFVGTTDNVALRFRTNNSSRMTISSTGNVGIGTTSPTGKLHVSGGNVLVISGNVGIGTTAPTQRLHVSGGNIQISTGNLTLTSGSITVSGGSISTGTDFRSGTDRILTIAGSQNVFVGKGAGLSNTTFGNTFVGDSAGFSNTSGADNVFIGRKCARLNTTGARNTFVGALTGIQSTGSSNTLVGCEAGRNIKSTGENTFVGSNAGREDTSGTQSTFIGANAGLLQLSGFDNTYVGRFAGGFCKTTVKNTALGSQAGAFDSTGNHNTYIGADATGLSGITNGTALGNSSSVSASNKVRIGNTSVTVIEGQVNFSASSDARLKTNVINYDLGLEFIKKLRPVSYQFKEGDTQTEHHGFIAQEVEASLEGRKFDALNKPKNEIDNYSLAYASFVVPLVNAVKELSKENTDLKSANEMLEKRIEKMEAALAENKDASSFFYMVTPVPYLHQNNPNPFNQNTTIGVYIPETGRNAFVKIYSADGKEIKSIFISSPGINNIVLDAGTLPAGNYQYSLMIDGRIIDSKQMIIVK